MILKEIIERMEGCANGVFVCDTETAREAADGLKMLYEMYCAARDCKGRSTEEEQAVMGRALAVYGFYKQVTKTNEEVGEFLAELNRHVLGEDNLDDVAQELADAVIMLDQMQLYLGIEGRVAEWRAYKLNRLWENVRPTEE